MCRANLIFYFWWQIKCRDESLIHNILAKLLIWIASFTKAFGSKTLTQPMLYVLLPDRVWWRGCCHTITVYYMWFIMSIQIRVACVTHAHTEHKNWKLLDTKPDTLVNGMSNEVTNSNSLDGKLTVHIQVNYGNRDKRIFRLITLFNRLSLCNAI